jgi:hypothetical protein
MLLAAPGAVFDRALIKHCPLGCGYTHIHHIPAGTWRRTPIVRAARCAPHRQIQLEVVNALPATTAGHRKRWSA